MISFTYFTFQTNLDSNQKIASQRPLDPPADASHNFQIMITLVVIVDLVYFSTSNQKHFLY